MRRFTFCFLILAATLVAAVALGQVDVNTTEIDVEDVTIATDQGVAWASAAAGLLVLVMNAIAAFVPSTNKLMKVVDAFAFNWGKARNDPSAQKWG